MKNLFVSYSYIKNPSLSGFGNVILENENIKISSADDIQEVEDFIALKYDYKTVSIINFRRME